MKNIEILGVYKVPDRTDVHLIEIKSAVPIIDWGLFTQEDREKKEESWQVAYDEHFLSLGGEEIVDSPKEPFRAAFFMHFLNFNAPLITPFGPLTLPGAKLMPERLSKIIQHYEVD